MYFKFQSLVKLFEKLIFFSSKLLHIYTLLQACLLVCRSLIQCTYELSYVYVNLFQSHHLSSRQGLFCNFTLEINLMLTYKNFELKIQNSIACLRFLVV